MSSSRERSHSKQSLLTRPQAVVVATLASAFFIALVWGWRHYLLDTSSPGSVASPFLCREVTAESGIDFTYRNGEEAGHYSMLETLGGGVALLDFDGDGLLDIFFTGGGYFDKTETQLEEALRL